MLSMKKEYGFRTFLDTAVILNLKHYFKNIHNVSKSESLCFYEYPWVDYFQSPQILGQDQPRIYIKLCGGRHAAGNVSHE